MKITVLIAGICCWGQVLGQQAIVDSLIHELHRSQIKENSFYDAGQFPAQRGYRHVQDNTVFFDALIAYTLQGLNAGTSSKTIHAIDSICQNIKENYSNYQNKTGICTYNFWKTNPAHFFPNGGLLSSFSAFHIPDDADCTAMIFLTDSSLTKNANWLQNKLSAHANLSKSRIKNTKKKFSHYKAYSTWFGERMPIEFDICVQSNVLLFTFKNKLPLTIQDEETIALLHDQIISGEYLKWAYYLSPSYKKKSIVLYHLARFLELAPVSVLQDCRAIVKSDIEMELTRTSGFMDQILLSTALIRMKGTPLPVIWPESVNKKMEKYVFFRANLFSSYARPSLKFITKSHLFDIPFYSKPYCMALIAEYEQLMINRIQTTR